jgi:hypothetical protein
MRRLPVDGSYDVPKHVADYDVTYIVCCQQSWLHWLYIYKKHGTLNVKKLTESCWDTGQLCTKLIRGFPSPHAPTAEKPWSTCTSTSWFLCQEFKPTCGREQLAANRKRKRNCPALPCPTMPYHTTQYATLPYPIRQLGNPWYICNWTSWAKVNSQGKFCDRKWAQFASSIWPTDT